MWSKDKRPLGHTISRAEIPMPDSPLNVFAAFHPHAKRGSRQVVVKQITPEKVKILFSDGKTWTCPQSPAGSNTNLRHGALPYSQFFGES